MPQPQLGMRHLVSKDDEVKAVVERRLFLLSNRLQTKEELDEFDTLTDKLRELIPRVDKDALIKLSRLTNVLEAMDEKTDRRVRN